MKKLILIFVLFFSLVANGQDTISLPYKLLPYPYNDVAFMIKDSGEITNDIKDCILCNPEIMNDRILLDTTKTMISRKTSNPLGYIYYDWRSPKRSKTYEEIFLKELNFKTMIFYSDSGATIEQRTYCSVPYTIFYYENNLQTIEKIRIQFNQQSTDSLIKTYNISRERILDVTRFWTEVNFYDNGEIKSTGIIITGMKNLNEDEYKVGRWMYYNSKGQFINKDTIEDR